VWFGVTLLLAVDQSYADLSWSVNMSVALQTLVGPGTIVSLAELDSVTCCVSLYPYHYTVSLGCNISYDVVVFATVSISLLPVFHGVE
jgi:hypothetical protein